MVFGLQVGPIQIIERGQFRVANSYVHEGMIYGYARVSTDGQSVGAQATALTEAGAGKIFKEVASGAKTDRTQLHRLLNHWTRVTCCW